MSWPRRSPAHRIVSPILVGIVMFLTPKDTWYLTSLLVFGGTMAIVLFDGKPISKAFIAGTAVMSVIVGAAVHWLE